MEHSEVHQLDSRNLTLRWSEVPVRVVSDCGRRICKSEHHRFPRKAHIKVPTRYPKYRFRFSLWSGSKLRLASCYSYQQPGCYYQMQVKQLMHPLGKEWSHLWVRSYILLFALNPMQRPHFEDLAPENQNEQQPVKHPGLLYKSQQSYTSTAL